MLTNLKNKMETNYGYANVRIGNNSSSDYMIYYAKDKRVRSKDMALHEEAHLDANNNLHVEIHIGREILRNNSGLVQIVKKAVKTMVCCGNAGKGERTFIFSKQVTGYDDNNPAKVDAAADLVDKFHKAIGNRIIDFVELLK